MRISTPRRSAPGPAALWLTLVMTLACLPGPAAGQPGPAQRRSEPVAIVKLPFQGVTPEVEASLRQALREALTQGGFEVLPDAVVEAKVKRDPDLGARTSRGCFARAAPTLGVLRVLEGEVQRPQRSTYRVRLQLRDLRTGQLALAPEEERCDICGTEEARQMIARVASRLCRTAPPLKDAPSAPDTGTLQLDSQPLGADVLIDGIQQEDRTPATFILPVGVHSVELRAPGYKPLRRPVEIGPGRHATLNLELIGIPPRRPWLTALSAGLLAGAVGLGVTSGILWHYHGKPVYCDYPAEDGGPCRAPQPHCPKMYGNVPQGVITSVLAAGFLIGGAVAIRFDYTAPKRLVVTPVAPALGPK